MRRTTYAESPRRTGWVCPHERGIIEGNAQDRVKKETAMRFSRVQSRKVSAIAAEQIVDAIHRGDFPVGSRLPSEFELAEQMGVSRPSIREALSALQAMAIIESRPGSGKLRAAGAVDNGRVEHAPPD